MDLSFLYKTALSYGVDLTQHETDLFRSYLDELNYWNQKINLTSLSSDRRIINELILDSIIPAPFLPLHGDMLDVGSGAGFPAIPLKIIRPQYKVRLVESNTKKVSFLKQVIRILELEDIWVFKDRIEHSIEGISHESYNLITARAFAPLARTISLCSPFLSPNGLLICFLGKDGEEVLEKNQHIIEKHCLTILKKIPYTLPDKIRKRYNVILEKQMR